MTASLLGQQGWTQDVGWAECGSLVIETLRRTTVVIRQHQAEPEVIKGPFYPWDESLFSWLFCLCADVLCIDVLSRLEVTQLKKKRKEKQSH